MSALVIPIGSWELTLSSPPDLSYNLHSSRVSSSSRWEWPSFLFTLPHPAAVRRAITVTCTMLSSTSPGLIVRPPYDAEVAMQSPISSAQQATPYMASSTGTNSDTHVASQANGTIRLGNRHGTWIKNAVLKLFSVLENTSSQ